MHSGREGDGDLGGLGGVQNVAVETRLFVEPSPVDSRVDGVFKVDRREVEVLLMLMLLFLLAREKLRQSEGVAGVLGAGHKVGQS